MTVPGRDRIGLAWRDELAAQLFLNLDRIDHLEILAEREMEAPRRRISSLRALARDIPVSLHGVSLGMASSATVSGVRLARMAKLVERIEPDHWSEHLAFVRAGDAEIMHLAAAPYCQQTIDGTIANLDAARRIVGAAPHLENIATLLPPPGSTWSECEFVSRAIAGCGAPLLLDLHNLYANAWNFGLDPFTVIASMPLGRVRTVHLSGGHFADSGSRTWLIDDHIHDPPDVVFQLLETLGRVTAQNLTIIIERDGRYPEFKVLLEQVSRARAALAAGRKQRDMHDLARVA